MRPDRTRQPLRSDLTASLADGGAFSLMVGLGETYVPAFVLAVGLGEVTAGLVGAVPLLSGAVVQLVSPRVVRLLGSHRRWVICAAALQGLSFIPLVIAAVLGSISAVAVFAIATLYWATGMGAAPAWNTWMGRVVPPRLRARFFARRTRVTQVTVLLGLLMGGALLQRAEVRDATLIGFAILFAAAGCCRLVSVGFLLRQREPTGPPVADRAVSPRDLVRRRAHAPGRLLTYMLCVQVAAYIAAPYFTPFMLGQLEFSYPMYVLLMSISFGAKIVALPALGRFAGRLGARRLLMVGGFTIAPLAGLWVISTAPLYLAVVQVAAGVAWAAYELATFLLLFEMIPDEERTSVLTTFNLVNAVALVVGSMLGGVILYWAGEDRFAYSLLFAISTGARLLTLPLLRRVGAVPPIQQRVGIRTLAVRPSAGSIDAPVLSSIGHPARSTESAAAVEP